MPFDIANNIWALVEDEGEANKGYAAFIAQYGERLSQTHLSQIKEIMSEESKHINILTAMAETITGIKAEE